MKKLSVQIEIKGISRYVGDIVGTDLNDACFTYAESYLADQESRSISISLPLYMS